MPTQNPIPSIDNTPKNPRGAKVLTKHFQNSVLTASVRHKTGPWRNAAPSEHIGMSLSPSESRGSQRMR